MSTCLPNNDVALEAVKKSQRGRFIGRHGYIALLEEQYNVHINMITPETSAQITKTLENAKAQQGSVTIHNRIDLSEGDEGEWILVRPKICEKQADTVDYEVLLDELTNRWKSFSINQNHKIEVKNDEELEESPNEQ
ncbi:unnamed protein product [Rotaria sp. Silwood1]|nr:unnamed protein product [Rotaria sp. Silwood1]